MSRTCSWSPDSARGGGAGSGAARAAVLSAALRRGVDLGRLEVGGAELERALHRLLRQPGGQPEGRLDRAPARRRGAEGARRELSRRLRGGLRIPAAGYGLAGSKPELRIAVGNSQAHSPLIPMISPMPPKRRRRDRSPMKQREHAMMLSNSPSLLEAPMNTSCRDRRDPPRMCVGRDELHQRRPDADGEHVRAAQDGHHQGQRREPQASRARARRPQGRQAEDEDRRRKQERRQPWSGSAGRGHRPQRHHRRADRRRRAQDAEPLRAADVQHVVLANTGQAAPGRRRRAARRRGRARSPRR